MSAQQLLTQLEEQLKALKQDGVTLSKRENHQIAQSLQTDVKRDLPPAKRKGFFRQMFEIAKQGLPYLLPIIKMIV